jgi:hypothetical protein
MGMLVLNRLMSLQRDRQRRRWQIRARCRRKPLPPNSPLALNVRLLRSMFDSLSSFSGRSPKCLGAFSAFTFIHVSVWATITTFFFYPVAGRLITSRGKRKGSSCQQDGDGISRAGKIMRSSIPDLPEVVPMPLTLMMQLYRLSSCQSLFPTMQG